MIFHFIYVSVLAWKIKEGNRPLLYKSLMLKFMIFSFHIFLIAKYFSSLFVVNNIEICSVKGVVAFFIFIKGGKQQRKK